MHDLLFHEGDLRATLEAQERRMYAEIDAIPSERLLNSKVEDLCTYFTEQYSVEPIVLNEGAIEANHDDAKVDVRGRFEYGVFDVDEPTYVAGTTVSFFIPYTGDRLLFKLRPSTFNSNPPRADIRPNEVVMTYAGTEGDAANFKSRFDHELRGLRDYLSWIARDVQAYNSTVKSKAQQKLESRRQKLLRDRNLGESLGFPLRRRTDTPATFNVPAQRRKIPKMPEASSQKFEPEPALAMEEYEHILGVITNMVLVMERSPHAFKGMREEDLRHHFLVQLNGHYEGQVTGETFNFEGKTDILIREKGRNVFIGECKFWDGPELFAKAIDQLLGYTTWRDTKTALLVFNRDRNLSTVLQKIPEVASAHKQFKKALPYSLKTGYRFVFHHRDDKSREVMVTVLVFEVPS